MALVQVCILTRDCQHKRDLKQEWLLGVKVRNLKMDFITGGTLRRVKQSTLITTIYKKIIQLSHLVTKHVYIKKSSFFAMIFFIKTCFVT